MASPVSSAILRIVVPFDIILTPRFTLSQESQIHHSWSKTQLGESERGALYVNDQGVRPDSKTLPWLHDSATIQSRLLLTAPRSITC